MNLGRYMMIIGGIIVAISYIPLPLLYFGMYPEFMMVESKEGSDTHSLVPYEIAPIIKIFTYGGIGLLIAGITYRFWRRK